nr:molybdopterin-dependent oxidoreductase [Asanoa ferruginea]
MWPGFAGLASATLGVSTGQLVATAIDQRAGPLYAVGGMVIDATPAPLKEFAVRTAGTYDKPLLLAGIAAAVAIVAAVLGIVADRRRWAGLTGFAALGGLGAAAALTRPGASALGVTPALISTLVTAGVLLVMLRPARPTAEPGGRAGLLDRRAFVGGVAVAAAVVTTAGVAASSRILGGAAARTRDRVRLPRPARPAAELAPGFVTPNADFYRVDTALSVPRVDADRWTLRVKGLVDRPFELSFDDLLREPMVEEHITLNCVSNEVGGPYAGTAKWLGVPLAALLRRAGVHAGADQIVARSVDGMTIGTPTATVLDSGTMPGTQQALLCVGMNGEPLPLEHGFPARMLTPGVYGYAGSCKWITEIELATFDAFDAYWVRRGYAARAPVKTASRIDRPGPFARLAAGPVVVAGVAWAQGRGIAAVEVQVDDGEWAPATLLPEPNLDTWTQWSYRWQARSGPHSLRVRAVDRTGAVQTNERASPFPNGATGWHTVAVTAT